jgi:RNA polymerase sigma-70 factor (ECF subfamily)
MQIQEILQKIDPMYRVALILVDAESYSYGEAAEIIGISEDALRSRLHKARKYFLQKLKK